MTDKNKRRAAHTKGYRQNLGYTEGRISLAVGQEIDIMVSGDWRPTTVLAVIGPEALLEYALPSGRSALRRVSVNYERGTDPGRPYRNENYRKLPKCWMLKLARPNIQWVASPQQSADLHVTPRTLFMLRWPDDEWMLYAPGRLEPEPREVTAQQMQEQRRRTDRVREGLTA